MSTGNATTRMLAPPIRVRVQAAFVYTPGFPVAAHPMIHRSACLAMRRSLHTTRRHVSPAVGFAQMARSNASARSNQASISATVSITIATALPILLRRVRWERHAPSVFALRPVKPANSPARAINNASMIRAYRSIAIKSFVRKDSCA